MKRIVLVPLFFFFFDALLWGLLGQNVVGSLFCFYALFLLSTTKTVGIVLLLLLLSLQSFMLDGVFGLPFLYLLPLSIIILEAQNLLRKTFWLPYALVLLTIVTHELVIKQLVFGFEPAYQFMLVKICVNLIIVLIFDSTIFKR